MNAETTIENDSQPDDRDQPEGDPSARRHEAMNLLMLIDLACENLLQMLPPGDPLREDVRQIVEARERLVDVVNATPRRR